MNENEEKDGGPDGDVVTTRTAYALVIAADAPPMRQGWAPVRYLPFTHIDAEGGVDGRGQGSGWDELVEEAVRDAARYAVTGHWASRADDVPPFEVVSYNRKNNETAAIVIREGVLAAYEVAVTLRRMASPDDEKPIP